MTVTLRFLIMPNGYDIAYTLALGIAAPIWLAIPKTRRKVLRALRERMGREIAPRDPSRMAIMIHAVSLGEMNATKALVDLLRQTRPDLDFIVSTTTDAGYERAGQLYGASPEVTLIRYPLDFSRGITRALDRLKPTLVVLMELEMWPNFLGHCRRKGIAVVVANGRMSDGSYRNYSRVRPIISGMFRKLTKVCAQDEAYASRFIDLGASPDDVVVTGTMKFDTAQVGYSIPGDSDLAAAVGLRPGAEPIWVCGSTGPGEEQIILNVYRALLAHNARLRLVIVPRHKPRWDEVAAIIETMKFQVVRRSRNDAPAAKGVIPPVVLGDTFGELRTFYSLADVVFVGRSLVDLGSKQHGSDMIEPAALGRPAIVGPFTGNFTDVMRRFVEADAIKVVRDESELRIAVTNLLASRQEATAMGERAQEVVRRQQGATRRHVEVILGALEYAKKSAWPVILKCD